MAWQLFRFHCSTFRQSKPSMSSTLRAYFPHNLGETIPIPAENIIIIMYRSGFVCWHWLNDGNNDNGSCWCSESCACCFGVWAVLQREQCVSVLYTAAHSRRRPFRLLLLLATTFALSSSITIRGLVCLCACWGCLGHVHIDAWLLEYGSCEVGAGIFIVHYNIISENMMPHNDTCADDVICMNAFSVMAKPTGAKVLPGWPSEVAMWCESDVSKYASNVKRHPIVRIARTSISSVYRLQPIFEKFSYACPIVISQRRGDLVATKYLCDCGLLGNIDWGYLGQSRFFLEKKNIDCA